MASLSWSQARAQMLLDPEAINLNTGSFGPLPRVVFELFELPRIEQGDKRADLIVGKLHGPRARDDVRVEMTNGQAFSKRLV